MNKSIISILIIAFSVSSQVLAQAQKPNVIYILADDLGYGDLSCYGQKKLQTPNIDRLAKEGIKFTNHYAGNTVCSPSRAVLMTGIPAGSCYIRGNINSPICALDSKWTVLPEIFKQAGYATGAYGKWGLGETNTEGDQNPLTHGFDEFFGWKDQLEAHTYYPSSYVHNGKEIPLPKGTYIHDLIMNQAFDFIRSNAKAKKPFFCYIPTAIPHAAMHAPQPLHDKWRKLLPQFDNKIGKYNAGPDEECPSVQNPIAGFAAMMEHLDNQVGELMKMLKELGVDNNTLIVFTSDNGAHDEGGHDPKFWNSTGGLRGGKRDMHEGGIRVPMLARWPNVIAAGTTTGHISYFGDVVPTMATLLGQSIPVQSKGISFLPTLQGKKKQPQHEYIHIEFRHSASHTLVSMAVRMGKWKAFQAKDHAMELYDLEADPFETKDLAASEPSIVKKMEQIMQEASDPSTLRTASK